MKSSRLLINNMRSISSNDLTVSTKLDSSSDHKYNYIQPLATIKWLIMSKQESKDTANVIEKVQDNVNVIASEISKLQLQYAQSLSNLQNQYIENTRNVIQNALSFQKTYSNNWDNWDKWTPAIYSDQIKTQTSEIGKNYAKSINIGNQVAINSMELVTENIKSYTRSLAMYEEFNRNVIQSWNSYYSPRSK